MKTFRAVIYSILSLALSAFCIFKIIESKDSIPSIKIRITDNQIINGIIDTTVKFADTCDTLHILGIGLISMIFYIVFTNPLHEFFSKLPLGSIRKYDYFKKPKSVVSTFSSVFPSLIIGLFITIHYYLNEFKPEKIDFFIKWFLPTTVLLVTLFFAISVVNIFLDGGLWGMIIRFPLLLAENLCLVFIVTALMMIAPYYIVGGVISILLSIGVIIAIFFYPRSPETKTVYIYRD